MVWLVQCGTVHFEAHGNMPLMRDAVWMPWSSARAKKATMQIKENAMCGGRM